MCAHMHTHACLCTEGMNLHLLDRYPSGLICLSASSGQKHTSSLEDGFACLSIMFSLPQPSQPPFLAPCPLPHSFDHIQKSYPGSVWGLPACLAVSSQCLRGLLWLQLGMKGRISSYGDIRAEMNIDVMVKPPGCSGHRDQNVLKGTQPQESI